MKIEHHFAGGAYAKESHIGKGEAFAQHSHPHDHLAILAEGVAWVTVDKVTTEYRAPRCISLPANKVHAVQAETDIVWFCLWATNDTDPATVDSSIMNGV